jgi:hypothetical protein
MKALNNRQSTCHLRIILLVGVNLDRHYTVVTSYRDAHPCQSTMVGGLKLPGTSPVTEDRHGNLSGTRPPNGIKTCAFLDDFLYCSVPFYTFLYFSVLFLFFSLTTSPSQGEQGMMITTLLCRSTFRGLSRKSEMDLAGPCSLGIESPTDAATQRTLAASRRVGRS